MAIRRPLVVVDGKTKELPIGDSLDGSSAGELFAIPISIINSSGDPECVFGNDGIIVVPRLEGDI